MSETLSKTDRGAPTLHVAATSSLEQDLSTLVTLGDRARAENDERGSFAFYARATELDPNSARAWAGRAATAPDLGEAIKSWAHALSLAPDGVDPASAVMQLIEYKLPKATPENASSLLHLGRILAEAGQKEGAHRLFEKATELDAANETGWLWRGSTTTDVDEALTCMERALTINPHNESARQARSWLRVKKLRLDVKTSRPADPSPPFKAARQAPLHRSRLRDMFLLVTPILIILLGLAALIWKLVL